LWNVHVENNPLTRRYEIEKRKLERLQEALLKLQVKETDKAENKTIALGTSKLNYLDPRISVAW
jgi:DNA topoisomerase-1